LVVQDLFLTETAALADVILPASAWPEKDGTATNTNRQVQMGRAAVPLPGDAHQDLEIIQGLARRLGLAWDYAGPREVFAEMALATPSLAQHHLGPAGAGKQRDLPLRRPRRAGDEIVFGDAFPTANGRARFVPAGSPTRPRCRTGTTPSCSPPAGSSNTGTPAP
jgi:formate dehydrogenase major subunit